jgi:hypothetical protein
MDDKGFIFTADATLALVVVIVITASIVAYAALPVYQGEDHQHLEALADSALNVMEQDGTLRAAAVSYANNNSTDAINRLNSSLSILIPEGIGYKITVGDYGSVSDDRGLLTSNDIVTRVKVISGPQEGWMGRAYYNIKEVGFVDQQINTTSTVWNFHNWLTNYEPWNNGFSNYPYWGCGYNWEGVGWDWRLVTYNIPINFSIPTNSTVTGANFLIGSSSSYERPFGINFVLNGNSNNVPRNSFIYLYSLSHDMYNYQGTINPLQLTQGKNQFYVNFNDVRSSNDMPWFSIIANYTTTIKVPQGVSTNTFKFPDAAGVAYPNYDRYGNENLNHINVIVYDLTHGTTSSSSINKRYVSWDNLVKTTSTNFENGVPFVITDFNKAGGNDEATAVCVSQTIDATNLGSIKDAYVNLNSYGATDGALVEVWDGTQWNVAFCSFDEDGKHFSDLDDGYGNIPGIIDIHKYLMPGQVNKVRITVWDDAPGNDFDLVGLTNCYTTVSSTKLPLIWDTYNYSSEQSGYNTNSISQTQTFKIRSNSSKEALLFFGVGSDTQNVHVEYDDGSVLYNGPVPYVLNLGDLDAQNVHKITSGTPTNYTFIPGDYNLKVTVTAGNSWASGDGASNAPENANAEIFSGTRVSVIYPALLQNIWSSSFASTPEEAKKEAVANLKQKLKDDGFVDIDDNLIVDEAMYAGDLPNSIPIRLDLWKQ